MMSLLPSKTSRLASRRVKRQRNIPKQLTLALQTLFNQLRLCHSHLSGQNWPSISALARQMLTSCQTSSRISHRKLSLCSPAPFCPTKAMLPLSLPTTRMAIISLVKAPSWSLLEKSSSCLSCLPRTFLSISASLTQKTAIFLTKKALKSKRKFHLS